MTAQKANPGQSGLRDADRMGLISVINRVTRRLSNVNVRAVSQYATLSLCSLSLAVIVMMNDE